MSKIGIEISYPKFYSVADKTAQAALLRAEGFAKSSILQGNKSGIKHSRFSNRSSAPGQAPANQESSGIDGPRPLVSTIGHEFISTGPIKTMTLYAKAPYALTLEKGDPDRSILARPFLNPAMRKAFAGFSKFDLAKEFVGVRGTTKKTFIRSF